MDTEQLIKHNSDRVDTMFNILDVLKECDLHHIDYAVAGGAVRDMLLGKEIRDIDVYITMPPGSAANKASFITKCLGSFENSLLWKYMGGKFDYEYSNDGIVAVFNNKRLNADFIFIKDAPSRHVAEQFGCGLSQALLYSTGIVATTDLFQTDAKEKSITFFTPERGKYPKRKYIRKLKNKYEDYTAICRDPVQSFAVHSIANSVRVRDVDELYV